MVAAESNATVGANTGGGALGARELPIHLGDVEAVRQMLGGISIRHVFRMADAGLMPWGVKIGARRMWNLAEIAEWIRSGCSPVQATREDRR